MVQLRDLFYLWWKGKDPHQDRLPKLGIVTLLLIFIVALAACDKDLSGGSNESSTAQPPGAAGDERVNSNSTSSDVPEGSSAVGDVAGASEADGGVSTEATLTPEVEKQIVVCLGNEPMGLFPYEYDSLAAVGLRHAIYENLYTSTGYDYQAQGLVKLPNIADGDVVMNVVTVDEGDRVEDVNGNVVALVDDISVVNSAGEAVRYNGSPIEMQQMQVDFSFLPMLWSDGTPVTAEDSVFSFELASDPQIVVGRERLNTTESYVATGDLSTRWTGIPGHIAQTYFLNVWEPLPSHQLKGMRAAELKNSDLTNKSPLSSGPYVIADWTAENEIVLVRNEHYYRKEEGYPFIDRIIVRFGGGEEFLADDSENSCDIIANDALHDTDMPLLEMAVETGQWRMLTSPGPVFEHIAFGINPVTEYAERRPDWFEDTRVRQAMTLCTDRQRMVDELTDGRAELLHAYVSESHRLFPDDLHKWPYDPDRANEILDEAGYLDFAGDGRRQDVSSGVPMTITIGTNSESSLRLHITEIFQENMVDCGIPVETYDYPAGTWFADGPIGRLFGRRFDLAQFAWISKPLPDCGLYLSENVPGPVEEGYRGWKNTNVTGWSNEDFDNACLAGLEAMPGGPNYDENQREALRIFAQELPVIPLFTSVKYAGVRPWIKNVGLDPSQSSMLWNIQEWDTEK